MTFSSNVFSGRSDRLKRVNHELLMLINERSERIEKAFKESVDDTFNMSDVIPLPEKDGGNNLDIGSGAPRTYDPNDYSGAMYDEEYSEAVDIEEDEIVPSGTQCAKLSLSRIIDPALIKLQLYGTRELRSSLSDDIPFGYKARKHYPNAGLKKKDSVMFHQEVKLDFGGKDLDGSANRVQDDAPIRKRQSNVSLSDLSAPKQLRPNPSSSNSLFELENQTEARRLSIISDSHYKKPLTMVVSHFVKWERTLEFENWLKDLFEIM